LASTPRDKHAIAASFTISPFARLARTHGLLAAGDAMVAVALADSVFFSATADAARSKVALYLLLTVAPFSVISPLIGPFIDKMPGGRRLMVIITALARAIAALAMVGNLNSLALYPLAFVHLVSIKAYGVAKTALVPTVVRSQDELVEANAKLGLISGCAAFAGALPMLPIAKIGWSSLIVVFAGLVFASGAAMSYGLPRTSVALDDAEQNEKAELRSAAIVLAASCTAVLRGIVGFMTFLVVFWFKRSGASTAWLGAAITMSTLGSLAGNGAAPVFRRSVREETTLAVSLGAIAVTALLASFSGARFVMCVLAGVVGLCATVGKLSFDAIVQRDAPGANQGRSLASFETKFQIAWVLAAFVPVLIPINGTVGAAILGVVAAAAAVGYLIGRQHIARHGSVPHAIASPLGWLWQRQRHRVGSGGTRPRSSSTSGARRSASQGADGEFEDRPRGIVIDVIEAPSPPIDRSRPPHYRSPFDEPPSAPPPVSEWLSPPPSSKPSGSPQSGSPQSVPAPPVERAASVPPVRQAPRKMAADPTLPLDWDETITD
jgi:hypothetical protein